MEGRAGFTRLIYNYDLLTNLADCMSAFRNRESFFALAGLLTKGTLSFFFFTPQLFVINLAISVLTKQIPYYAVFLKPEGNRLFKDLL
jgi:uncharacterized membrane protein YkgB